MLKTLAVRFSEPSSWAGLAGVVGMFGVNLPSGTLQSIAYVGAGVAGLLAFFLPETK